jgi:hypothetical protein
MQQATMALVATLIAGLGIAGPAQARGGHAGEASRAGHGRPVASIPDHRAVEHGDAGFQRHVDGRQAMQRHRIQKGRRSGALTHKEAKGLRGEQRRIANLERRFRADGDFSRGERRALHRSLGNASRHIYRKTHNDRPYVRHHGRHLPRHGEAVGLWSNGISFFWYDRDAPNPSRFAHRRGHAH